MVAAADTTPILPPAVVADMTMLETLEETFDARRALVFGAGGSGDIVGAVPTARLLEGHGVDVTLGGLTWEPVPHDSEPGPRSLDEIRNVERVGESVGLVTGETVTADGMEFTETAVARHFDEETVLIDMDGGPAGTRRGLETACEKLGFDLVVGVDAGGDALARGDEPGLRSPVTDGYALSALAELPVQTALGVFGYGSDGELTREELEAAISRIAGRDGLLGAWGLTRRVRDEMRDLLEVVDTEASRLPVEAAGGAAGERTIRGGEVELELTPPSTVTFYFSPDAVAAESGIASAVRGLESLEAAVETLRDEGYQIEFDTERERLETGG